MKLSGGQLLIALSAIETKPDSRIVDSLQDITITMIETRRNNPDTS